MSVIAIIFAIALTAWSAWRLRRHPSFGAWWNAEGLPVWIMAGIVLFALMTSRYFSETHAQGFAAVRAAYHGAV